MSHVFVVRGDDGRAAHDHDRADPRPVTEVLQGLSAGEMVAISGLEALSDGAQVHVGPGAAQSPAARRVGAAYAVACGALRSTAGVRVGAGADARRGRGVRLLAARGRSVSQGRFPDDHDHDAAAWRRAGADRDRGLRQDRGSRQHDQRPRRAALDVRRGRVDRDGVVPAREGRRRRRAGGARQGQPHPAAAAAHDPAAGHREDGHGRGAGARHRGVAPRAGPRGHRVRGQGAAAPPRDGERRRPGAGARRPGPADQPVARSRPPARLQRDGDRRVAGAAGAERRGPRRAARAGPAEPDAPHAGARAVGRAVRPDRRAGARRPSRSRSPTWPRSRTAWRTPPRWPA